MVKGHKIPPPTPPRGGGGAIRTEEPPPVREVVFGFKYLDITDKYTVRNKDSEYLLLMLNRWKEISRLQRSELFQAGKSWRCHTHDWSKTKEKDGFKNLPRHLRDYEGVQIGLGMKKGRVHGFFIQNVFNVVWLDPDHQVWD